MLNVVRLVVYLSTTKQPANARVCVVSVNQLSWHRVVCRVCSPIAQTREPLKFAERHACAAPLLCGYSCTRSGAAGQGWHQPGEERTSISSTPLWSRRLYACVALRDGTPRLLTRYPFQRLSHPAARRWRP